MTKANEYIRHCSDIEKQSIIRHLDYDGVLIVFYCGYKMDINTCPKRMPPMNNMETCFGCFSMQKRIVVDN